MGKGTRTSSPLYSLLPSDIEGSNSLAELALDLHWSRNHGTDFVWKQLDPALWELTQNPVSRAPVLDGSLSQFRLCVDEAAVGARHSC